MSIGNRRLGITFPPFIRAFLHNIRPEREENLFHFLRLLGHLLGQIVFFLPVFLNFVELKLRQRVGGGTDFVEGIENNAQRMIELGDGTSRRVLAFSAGSENEYG